MNVFSRNAARAAAAILFSGAIFAAPAMAQRVQDVTPLPSTTAPVAAPVAATTTEATGPRVQAEMPRVEANLEGSASTTMKKKDNMNTITISTIALVLLVVLIVLLVK